MANGFASSFEKSFIPAAKSSSDATLELIQERIKKQETKTLEEAKSLQAKKDYENIRSFIGKKNPELAGALAELDTTDMGTDNLNKITGVLIKQTAPKIETDVDKLIKAGKVGDALIKLKESGMLDGTVPQVEGITTVATGVSMPTSTPDGKTKLTPKPGDIVPTKFNALGIPTAFEIFKPSEAEGKHFREGEILAKGVQNLVMDFNDGMAQRDSFLKSQGISDTFAGLPPGTQKILGGKLASAASAVGASNLDKVQAFNRRRKAFATRVAKAAGEERPTDEDIDRFLGTLPSFDLPDPTNASLITGLIDDLNARGAEVIWAERTSGAEPRAEERKSESSKYKEGQTATGKDGKKLVYKGGKWQSTNSK